jgi:REP element-mobilizing transposase RayT
MSRPLRIDYQGAWHHVMNRARRGYDLYLDNEDYEVFLSLLKETAALFQMNIAAYCLMPNHYHMLVKSSDGNLARCMRHINGVYTQKYNTRYKSDGTLFRGRYKSILVQEDSYLLQLVRYIHKNPVKAGLTENPEDYRWCSHSGYVSTKRIWSWLYKDFILSMITPEKKQQVRQYKTFMGSPVIDEIESFYSKKNLSSILGDLSYVNWVKETFFKEKSDVEVPESKHLAPETDCIIDAVTEFYGIGSEQLFHTKRGVENEPRNVAIYMIRILRADPLNKIGQAFNLSRTSSVSSAIERVHKKLEKDNKFKKRVDEMKKRFTKS